MFKAEQINSLVTLVEIRDNPKAPTSVRVMCANAILDRAMGRPAQRIEPVVKIASSDPVGDVERLEAEIRQLSKNTFPASARRTKPAAMADNDVRPQAGSDMRDPVLTSSVTGDSRERPALFNRRHPIVASPSSKARTGRPSAESAGVRVLCARDILDRSLGKPVQHIQNESVAHSEDPVAEVERLEAEVNRLRDEQQNYGRIKRGPL